MRAEQARYRRRQSRVEQLDLTRNVITKGRRMGVKNIRYAGQINLIEQKELPSALSIKQIACGHQTRNRSVDPRVPGRIVVAQVQVIAKIVAAGPNREEHVCSV